MNKLLLLLTLTLLLNVGIKAQENPQIGISEKLGDYLPLETEFVTSDYDTVQLKDLITKPVLLAFVYYECPGICSPLLTDLARVSELIDLIPGKDFEIITISFDSRETPDLAAKWKKNYFFAMKGKFPEENWQFLTGDSSNILKLTNAAGFYFKKSDDDNFTHAGLVLSVSPKGKISRYIYGSRFNRFDLKMALLDAEAGKTSPAVAKFLQYCFSYDPEGRGYTLNITRIFGTLILGSIAIFLGVLLFRKKKSEV